MAWWKKNRLAKYATHEGLERLKQCRDAFSILLIVESEELGSPELKAAAVGVLGGMPCVRAKQAFRKCLHSSDEMTCICAINAVSAGRLTEYVKDLEELAKNSESEVVRIKARWGISKLQNH